MVEAGVSSADRGHSGGAQHHQGAVLDAETDLTVGRGELLEPDHLAPEPQGALQVDDIEMHRAVADAVTARAGGGRRAANAGSVLIVMPFMRVLGRTSGGARPSFLSC